MKTEIEGVLVVEHGDTIQNYIDDTCERSKERHHLPLHWIISDLSVECVTRNNETTLERYDVETSKK